MKTIKYYNEGSKIKNPVGYDTYQEAYSHAMVELVKFYEDNGVKHINRSYTVSIKKVTLKNGCIV